MDHWPTQRQPDRAAALEQYAKIAGVYDRLVKLHSARKRAIRSLELSEGETIIEAGCGTGINFSSLRRSIGDRGRIIGIDQSGDMLAQARARIQREGWHNIELIESPAESATVTVAADALFLAFTHDLLQTSAAITNMLRALKRDGRVVAVCARWDEELWPSIATTVFRRLTRRYVTTFEGFDRPGEILVHHLKDVTYKRLHLGTVFIIKGTVDAEKLAQS